ncbi:BufA2 family periplasmic bufferin-type metallophore [Nitrospira sp. M1]
MSSKSLLMGAALTGMLIASGCAHSHDSMHDSMSGGQMAKGECHGVNDCKGHGECKGAGQSCEGKNDCKGKGWVSMSQADCDAKGGQYVAKSH